MDLGLCADSGTPLRTQGTNRCRVAAPPTVDLFYACQGATVRGLGGPAARQHLLLAPPANCSLSPRSLQPHQVSPCYSEYYWAVTVSLEVLHVTTTSAGGGGNATAEVVTSPREAPTQLTVRPHTPWLADASALASRFVPDGRVPCTVDAVTGAVRVHDNFTLPAALPTGAAARQGTAGPGSPGVASLRRHHPVSGGPLPGSPGPLAVVVLHALWGSFLDGLGVARRPPPLWLIRMGWLPWWRVVGPGVPLISLSSLLTAVRLAELRTSLLDAVIVPVMLAAAAEAACAVLAEAQAAAHERARSGASMLPVWCALAYVLSAAALVLLCVAQPVARELRRGWRALSGSGDGAMAPHPLGEPLRRSNSGRLRPLTRSQTMGLRID